MRTILVSAYGCEPNKGSEPGVGWNWVIQMAKNNTLHVITRANNRDTISKNIPKEIASNIIFHYYDTPIFIRKLKDKDRGLYFYYFCWQIGIISLVRKLNSLYSFDYTIHISFGSMWMPTFLPLFRIPFIWGPVGGGEHEPFRFIKALPLKQKAMLLLRYVMNMTSILNPFIVIPSWRAKAIIVRTPNSRKVIPNIFRDKTYTLIETAMDKSVFQYKKKENASNKIHFIVTGRLVANKNTISCVKALALLPKKLSFHLTIVGSGPERRKIEDEISKNNLAEKVTLTESISRDEVLELLTQSDIFLFPSLREGGSWSLMEAMAIGLPVVCLNWSGMQIITNEESAIRLSVSSPKQMPKDMAEAIIRLIEKPELRKRMGESGRKRIKDAFNWEAKGTFIEQLLDELDIKHKQS